MPKRNKIKRQAWLRKIATRVSTSARKFEALNMSSKKLLGLVDEIREYAETKKGNLKDIADGIDRAAWNIERVADQLRDNSLADALKAEVKLLRRYAQWLRAEADRRTESEPESS